MFWKIISAIVSTIYIGVFIYSTMMFYSDMNRLPFKKRLPYSICGSMIYTFFVITVTPLILLIMPYSIFSKDNRGGFHGTK